MATNFINQDFFQGHNIRNLTNGQLNATLSIDSTRAYEKFSEVSIIKLSTKSKEKEVAEFLRELKNILNNEKFNPDSDFILIKARKEKALEQFSTTYTMHDLEYDVADVIERLKELSIQEYSDTLIDKDNTNPPLLFVFGKDLNGRQVYIKLKIKGETKRRVLCVSFHYAQEKMHFPYA